MKDKYSCSWEWVAETVAILRLHAGPDGTLGDPYLWCVTIKADGVTAYLKAVMVAPPNESLSIIAAALRDAGFTRRKYERFKGKREITEKEL